VAGHDPKKIFGIGATALIVHSFNTGVLGIINVHTLNSLKQVCKGDTECYYSTTVQKHKRSVSVAGNRSL